MSRKILAPVLAVAAVALSVIAPPLGAIVLAGMKIGVATLLAAGLAVGSALLAPKPRMSSSTTERLLTSFEPNAPRKIVFGHTAMATDIRYHSYTSEQTYYHQILAIASHEVAAIEQIWFDSELAWSASVGVGSKWSGYLTVAPKLVGSAGNTVSIDANWGANQRLTGVAYIHLRYKLTGNSKKAESPFAQSIPSRVTIRGKGALLPDIRESGCEADDQASWAWYDDDSGRNPALQLLFYLVGWRIADKLAVGRGIPPARIDLDSFVSAANFCDEPVSLAAGGTEPRYRSDGIFSESDDPSLVIGNLCAAMNAVLRDNGGQIAVHCLHNDLAAPVASFSEADIIEGDDWLQTPAVDEYFETVRGRYVDPSDTALYQMVDYPEVQIGEDDSRVDSFDLPVVQSASQAQRLAKARLQRNLYRGVFSATFNHKAWQVNLGDPVTLSHAALGWDDKLFRVASHSIGLDGRVEMVLNEEHADIYAWDEEESPAVQAAEPTAYDPLLSPIVLALQELEALGITGYLTNEAHTVPASSAGAVSDYSGASTAFVVVQNGTADISNQFTLSTKSGGNPQGLTVSYNNGANPRTMTVTAAGTSSGQFGHGSTDTASLTILATGSGDYAGVLIEKVFSLTKSKAGATGAAAKLLYLISDRQLITYNGAGALTPGTQVTTFTVQPQNLSSSSYQISMTTQAGTTINANTYLASAGTLTPSGNNAILTGSATFTMSAANFDAARAATSGVIVTVTHVADGVSDKISVLKAQDGSAGDDAKTLYVISDRQLITYDGAGAVSPSTQTTRFQIQAQNLSTSNFTLSMTTAAGTTIDANLYLTAGSGGTLTASGNNGILTGALDFTMTAANFDTARAATQGVIVTVAHADGVIDKIGIVKGQDGEDGADAKTLYVVSDRQIISYDASGSPAPSTQTTAFTVRPQHLSSATFTVSMATQSGTPVNANTYLTATGGGTLTASGNNGILTGSLTFQLTAANFDAARGATAGILVTVAHADGVSDIISIVGSQDGADGADGADGRKTMLVFKRARTQPATPTGNGTPAGWSVAPEDASVGAYRVGKTIVADDATVAVTALGAGEYNAEQVGGSDGLADYAATASGSHQFAGDFVARIRPGYTSGETGYAGVLIGGTVYGWAFFSSVAQPVQAGSFTGTTATYTLGTHFFVRRAGTTITFLKGTSPDVGAATLVATYGSGVSGAGTARVLLDTIGADLDYYAYDPGEPAEIAPQWMSASTQEADGTLVGAWATPVQIDGSSGIYRDIKFRRSPQRPATPTGNDPAGWSDGVPAGTDTLWSSTVFKTAAGNLIGSWSTPETLSGLTPRGTYSASETYYLNNVVLYGGGSYIAVQDNFSNHAPSGTAQANAWWDVLSAPGDPGEPATPPGAYSATINLASSTGTVNLRTIADANGYTGFSDATITFNVPSGVTIRGLGGTPNGGIGIDTGAWPTSDYTIALTLVVQSGGIVDGGGGGGGDGGDAIGGSGGPGGDALYCRLPLSGGVTVNSGGTLRAGGGGGGGGGRTGDDLAPGEPGYKGGSGGGGGAPNGPGGPAGISDNGTGAAGASGTTSGGGAGGTTNADGGAGGTFGASGGTGQTGASDTYSSGSAGGPGGVAGYAVRKNGHAVTVTNNGTMTGTAA